MAAAVVGVMIVGFVVGLRRLLAVVTASTSAGGTSGAGCTRPGC